MKRTLKIAFHLNCLTHGGAERVVTNLANQFCREGHEVVIATEWIDENEFVPDPGVRRVNIGLKPEDEDRNRLSKYVRRIQYLRQFMKEEKPDVLIAFARLALYRALMACKGTGVPVVISVRIDPAKYYAGLRDKILIARYMNRAAGAVFQTPDAQAFFAPRLQDPETCRVIVNPINEKYVQNPDYTGELRKEVVNVARVEDFKNQPMLVDAFAMVHEKHPDYELKIYGPDSGDGTWQTIERKAQEYGIADQVHLMGNSDSLEKQVPGAAVFAYSSDYEGMPNSLMEAMAMGLPCVSTDCPPGGPKMLIEPGVNGLLVPVGDAKALAEKICWLIENPEEARRMGSKAREIRDRANMKAIYEAWKDLLLHVV